MADERRARLADLLDSVAAGDLDAADAIKQLNEWTEVPWREKPFADAYHSLQHFAIDADIRLRDTAYDADQRAGLRANATRLRQDRAVRLTK